MRLPKIFFSLFFLWSASSLAIASSSNAITSCAYGPDDPHQVIYFYDHPLGVYNVHLGPTLAAIHNSALQAGNTYPFYAKPWFGPIANLCPNGGCYEFTVYPNRENFTNEEDPNIDIFQEIVKIFGQPNRGEVRVITDHDLKHYVYTTDHETTFCGPYAL